MKIYMFYFKDTNETRSLEPILYAYTNSKEYAERFREFRNMDKFKEVIRNISKYEYVDFSRSYSNQQLTKTQFITKNRDFGNKKTKVEIVCTWEEEKNTILSGDDFIFSLFKDVIFNPSLLSTDIQGMLYKMGFFTMYQYLYQRMYIFEPLEGPEYSGVFFKDSISGDFPHEYNKGDFQIDQLEVFLHLYAGTIE